MKYLVIIPALAVAGCATSGAGLQQSKVERTWSSAKASKDVAICFGEAVRGNTDIRNDGDHYWVIRNSSYGPMTRYDFQPDGKGGTMIERRSGFNVGGAADDKLEACL